MPRGPKSEKRLGDVIGAAVMVAKIGLDHLDEPPRQIAPFRKPFQKCLLVLADVAPHSGSRARTPANTQVHTDDAGLRQLPDLERDARGRVDFLDHPVGEKNRHKRRMTSPRAPGGRWRPSYAAERRYCAVGARVPVGCGPRTGPSPLCLPWGLGSPATTIIRRSPAVRRR
jgi:hypothetical protein